MMGQTQPSVLDLVPGARNAVNYLLGKVADFQRVPQRLSVAQTNLVNIKRVAESKNRFGPATEAALAIQTVANLQLQHQQASGSVANALDQLRNSGLLAGPIDVAVSVVDAAGRVTSILKGTESVEASVRSISNKVMTTEEQATAQTASAGGGFTKYLLYGGLAYIGLLALRKSRGTRRF